MRIFILKKYCKDYFLNQSQLFAIYIYITPINKCFQNSQFKNNKFVKESIIIDRLDFPNINLILLILISFESGGLWHGNWIKSGAHLSNIVFEA